MAGMDNSMANSTPHTDPNPTIIATLRVAPDRLMPGSRATIWATPTARAAHRLVCIRPRWPRGHRSATKSTAAVTRKQIATPNGWWNMSLSSSRNSTPTTPSGTEATAPSTTTRNPSLVW